MASSKPIVVLRSADDWEEWYFIIQSRAKKAQIFAYIDPSKATKPAQPTKPVKPTEPEPSDDDNDRAWDRYKIRREDYKEDLKQYEKHTKEINDLSSVIEDSVSQPLLPILLKLNEDSHPYSQLRALKARLQPTSQTQEDLVINRLRQLEKSPSSQNLEKWLAQWEEAVFKAEALGLPDVSGDRGKKNFLKALTSYDVQWAANRKIKLQDGELTKSLQELIVDYRNYHRQGLAENPKVTKAAFAATLRNQQQETRTACICGFQHAYYKCYYLNPAARPKDWKPNEERQAKVDEALTDPTIKSQVDKSIMRNKDQKSRNRQPEKHDTSMGKASGTPADSQGSATDETSAFPAVVASAFSTQRLSRPTTLDLSWITDTGSTHHICNKFMKSRFKKTRDAGPDDYVTAGNSQIPIESFGEVTVKAHNDKGPRVITLLDVAYVPLFMANLVSVAKAREKGIEMDTGRMCLYKGDFIVSNLTFKHNHFFMEYNPAADVPKVNSNLVVRSLPATQWHEIFAHANQAVIKAIPNAAEGAALTEEQLPQHCDVCARTKAHQQISRSSQHEESSEEAFYRLSFDLVQLIRANNGHQWLTHIECAATKFTFSETHLSKDQCNEIILNVIQMIKTRFNRTVAFFRSDGETSLSHEFRQQLRHQGITHEVSAPYTPQQNGSSERSGHAIVLKARALRVSASLPEGLWPEIVKAATYLHNRTPMKRHQWKTPFEMVHDKQPNVAHLRVYGCKAYSLRKTIPRNNKLDERVLIGYLVGYDSTNIYRIWYPPSDRIVRMRDVTFDESSKFSQEDLEQFRAAQQGEPQATSVVPRIRLNEEDIIHTDEESEASSDERNNRRSRQRQERAGAEASSKLHEPQSTQMPSPSPSDSSSGTPAEWIPPQQPASQSSGGEEQPRRLGLLIPVRYDTEPDPGAAAGNRAPRGRDISADINPNLIVQGKRTRKARQEHETRRQAYTALITNNMFSHQTFINAFTATLNIESPETETKQLKDLPRIHRDNLPPEPRFYKEIFSHPLREHLLKAVDTELQEVQGKGVWKAVLFSEAQELQKEIIPLTWVFKYKFDEHGWLIKVKARICVRGDLQTSAADTFAATLASRIFRALIAIICAFDLETRQYDVVNAFPHVPLQEKTFCRPPEGMDLPRGQILLLLRALYGLKESPSLWQKHLCQSLEELGLEPVPDAPCLYANNHLFVFFFVDDIIMAYHKQDEQHASAFQEKLFHRYEMRILGEVQWFLALRIVRDRQQRLLWLSQESYITGLVARYNVKETYFPATPLPSDEVLEANQGTHASPQDIHAFQSKIGSVQFAAVSTRVDIAYACSALSSYLTNPSPRHLELAQRLLGYLAGTRKFALCYQGFLEDEKNIFTISSDAAYGNDHDTRRSHQGSIIMLYGAPVDWKATKQPTVTTSTTEAEPLALSEAAKQCFWWKRFFRGIQFDPGHRIDVQCDNTQTLRLMQENMGKLTTRLRHVDIHHHWLRQEAQAGNIHLRWTPTAAMIADGLTKALPRQKHNQFVKSVGLVPFED